MPKRKAMAAAITPTQRKSRGYLILDQQLSKKKKKSNKNITSTPGKNLQSMLCQNKPKLLPNIHPRVYQLDCSCNATYIAESKKEALMRCIEHPQNSILGNWESSGATEHTKECHGQFNWIHTRTITVMQNLYIRKIRETLNRPKH